MFGEEAYMPAAVPMTPTMVVTVGKLDNGYVLKMSSIPKPRPVQFVAHPLAGMDPDEAIDKMIDGVGAFMRAIHNNAAEEDWKKGEDRAKVREAIKELFPSLLPPAVQSEPGSAVLTQESDGAEFRAKSESRVFESKLDLIKYLTEKL